MEKKKERKLQYRPSPRAGSQPRGKKSFVNSPFPTPRGGEGKGNRKRGGQASELIYIPTNWHKWWREERKKPPTKPRNTNIGKREGGGRPLASSALNFYFPGKKKGKKGKNTFFGGGEKMGAYAGAAALFLNSNHGGSQEREKGRKNHR